MTTQRATRWLGALVALLLVGAGLLLVQPAQAATKVVTLTAQGPSPMSITIARGDVVRFLNNDSVQHIVKASTNNWAFNKTIAAGDAENTAPFLTAGTFRYTDSHNLVAIPQQQIGTIVVTAPAATASPKPSPKPSATRSPAPKPTTAPRASTSPTPAPVPTGSGTAVAPGFGSGGLPPIGPLAPSAGPGPDLAPPVGATASSAPLANISYGDRNGVVQGSPHRYGLPAALAVVGITGIASLLVRLLLAHPAARRRRTGPAVTVES